MKCYACGQNDGHLINCPEHKRFGQPITKPNQLTFPKPTEEDPEIQRLLDMGLSSSRRQEFGKFRQFKKRLGFLPLSTQEGVTVPAMSIKNIQAQPQLPSKPYRLWIDHNIAGCFEIVSIRIGFDGGQFVDMGHIPATMFQTGRWPLPKEPDSNLEFGIDLSTWKTIEVSQYFTLTVNNISGGCMPFRAALEVWCIEWI